MKIRVLVVDDSTFFRKQLTKIIEADPDLEVAGTAVNGKDGIDKCRSLRPDVITMDVEMPVMTGVEATRAIMAEMPTPILMFSSLTKDGASLTFDALDAGALDYMTKNFNDVVRGENGAAEELCQKIKNIAHSRALRRPSSRPSASPAGRPAGSSASSVNRLAGGASTSVGSGLFSHRAPAPSSGSRLGNIVRHGSTSLNGWSKMDGGHPLTISEIMAEKRRQAEELRASGKSEEESAEDRLRNVKNVLSGAMERSAAENAMKSGLGSRPAAGQAGSAAQNTLSRMRSASRGFSTGSSGIGARPVRSPLSGGTSVSAKSPDAARGTGLLYPGSLARVTGKLDYSLLFIGASTGGPMALQKVIPLLPASFPLPVIIVQHMPVGFTEPFANRLDRSSKIHVKEAEPGDTLAPGNAYIAPGGKQMILERAGGTIRLKIGESSPDIIFRPCIDLTAASVANVYGGRVLSVILTGMGADGCKGCSLIRNLGGTVWAQNEETCVVYGMPQAVMNAGVASTAIPLEYIAEAILTELRGGS